MGDFLLVRGRLQDPEVGRAVELLRAVRATHRLASEGQRLLLRAAFFSQLEVYHRLHDRDIFEAFLEPRALSGVQLDLPRDVHRGVLVDQVQGFPLLVVALSEHADHSRGVIDSRNS